MGIIARVELEFDTVGADPDPWWRPFVWWRWYRDQTRSRQAVVRMGVLGLHIGFSLAYQPADISLPKR